jgi:ATP-dependent helicase/nuclease subunit B
VDRASLFLEAAGLVRDRTPATLIGLPVLLLDVRVGSEAEAALVSALAQVSPSMLMTVPDGDQRTRSFLSGTIDHVTGGDQSSSLARVRQYLFSNVAPQGERDGEVRFFSAPGEGRECVEVARRILQEAARGVPFDEVAIVVRTPESYWGPLEHALTRAGIAAWYARGTRRPDPSGRAFLALLACAAEGLSAKRFGEYLSLGQVPPRDERGAPSPDPLPPVAPREETLDYRQLAGQLSLLDLLGSPAAASPEPPDPSPEPPAAIHQPPAESGDVRTPWKWETLIVESSVVGGAGRWRRRLDGLSRELQLRLDEAESEEPDSPRGAAIRRDLAALDDLRSFALPIIDDLAALPTAATWAEWLERLEALAPRALRHPVRVLELIAELRPMSAIGPLTLAEVRQVLVPRLATLDREPPRQRYGRVFVCTPDQLRGRTFRVVFVTGLAERIFPQRTRQDPLLLDGLRRALGGSLPVEDDRVVSERLLLKLAAGAPTERLYLSYPRLDVAQARPRVPSFYALDLVRALTGVVPNHEDFERDTALDTGAWLAWPAPADAATAIDDWEHDLATLGPLLKPGAGEPHRGQAHYLLGLNEHLARSLRARWKRWKPTWSSSDGLIFPGDQTKQLLASQRPTERPFSVSALQRFAVCPYQFLLGALYRLEPLERPEPLLQLDPLTRGALFHEVQRDALRLLQTEDLLPVVSRNREQALGVLDRAFDAVVDRYHDELAPAIERVWQDETDALRGDLRMWINQLAATDGEWLPLHFELSFGLPLDAAHDPASVPDPVRIDGRFLLRGAVDLVERRAVTGQLRVTDHKTGRNRTATSLVVGGGATLQPVLYGLAIEQVFGQPVTQSRLSFATTAGGFTEHVVSLRDEARRDGVEVLEIIDRAIETGCLPPAPRPGACGFCDFQPVCGPVEEPRYARKRHDKAVVGDLNELRSKR